MVVSLSNKHKNSTLLKATMKRTFSRYLMQASLFLCMLISFSGSTAALEYPDRLTLLGLLENRRFVELETLLQSFQTDYEKGEGDERLLAFALETLANSNPEYEALIADWIALHSGSYVPYLVRAYYYHGVAWSWRGHRARDKTNLQRLGKMKDYLQLAAGDITQAIRMKPRLSAADALALKVLMMLDEDDYKERTLQEALQISPDSYLIRSSHVWSLKPEWGGRPDELMQFIKKTGEDADNYPQLKPLLGYSDYIFAESLAEQKRFEEAAVHFDFAVNKGADYIIYRERGINYYHLNKYELALQDFNHSLMLWPQNPQTLRWRSHTLRRLSSNTAALSDLELAVRLMPMDRYVLMAHALLLRKLGQYEQVLSDYEKALFYNIQDADIWFERGMHYSHELINFEAAQRDLKHATELNPDEPAYWYEYAAVLHYKLDCEIVLPLKRYLDLCDTGSVCRAGELKWARHAQNWLFETNRCLSDL